MSKRFVEALIEELDRGDRFGQWKAARDLGRLGDGAAVESLIRCLYREDDTLRKIAATSLGNLGDPRATESLVRCLESEKDQPVRWEAAVSLGKLGNSMAIEPLLHALSDEDGELRRRAANSLKQLKVGPASLKLSIQNEGELVEGQYGRLSMRVENNGEGPALGLKVILSGPFSDKRREYNVTSRLDAKGEKTLEDSISPDAPGYIPLELSLTYKDVAKPNSEVLKYQTNSIKVRERLAEARFKETIPHTPVQVYGNAKISYGPITEHSGTGDFLQAGAAKQQGELILNKGQAVPHGMSLKPFLYCPYCGTSLGHGSNLEACPGCGERLR